jgi:hypothetical protein
LLVPFGNAVATRDAILQISSMDRQERAAWGNRNLAIARQRADWTKNFQKLLAAYETLGTIDLR